MYFEKLLNEIEGNIQNFKDEPGIVFKTVTVVVDMALLPTLFFIAVMSVMLFDAPWSKNSELTVAIFCVIWVCVIAVPVAFYKIVVFLGRVFYRSIFSYFVMRKKINDLCLAINSATEEDCIEIERRLMELEKIVLRFRDSQAVARGKIAFKSINKIMDAIKKRRT